MVETREMETIVERVLKNMFGDAKIGDVRVVCAHDEDGDDILLIKVEFSGTEEEFDASVAVRVVRHMRSRLAEAQVQAFPVISYLSSSEMNEVRDAVG